MDLHQSPTNPEQRLLERLTALEQTVQRLIAGNSPIQTGTTNPTHSAPNGQLYLNTATNVLFARSGGTWRFVALA